MIVADPWVLAFARMTVAFSAEGCIAPPRSEHAARTTFPGNAACTCAGTIGFNDVSLMRRRCDPCKAVILAQARTQA
jgi:hypothetical protein